MRKIFQFIAKYLEHNNIKIIIFFVVNLTRTLIVAFIPVLVSGIMNILAYSKEYNELFHIVILLSVLNLFNVGLTYLYTYLYTILQVRVSYNMTKNILGHIQKLSIVWVESQNSAHLSQRITKDGEAVVGFVLSVFADGAANVIMVAVSVYMLASISGKLCIVLLLIYILYVLGYKLLKSKYYQSAYDLNQSVILFFTALTNQIKSVRFILLQSADKYFQDKLQQNFETMLNKRIKNQKLAFLFDGIQSLISVVSQFMIFMLGGSAVIEGSMNIGSFTILTTYFNKLLNTSKYFLNLGKSYQDCLVSYNRIFELLDKQTISNGTISMKTISSIRLENISLSIQSNTIIENLSLLFQKGKIYVLKGDNGAGKSTVAKLILGIYNDSYQGNIYFNDSEMHDIDMITARGELIGIAEQEPLLIEDNIYNNITLGKQYDIQELESYVRMLDLQCYMDAKGNAWEAVINEKSNNISGGEKQKIEIIRQMVNHKEILIFDEPTSALDQKSCKLFMDYINRIKHDRIIIIITHDEKVYSIADKIVEIRK